MLEYTKGAIKNGNPDKQQNKTKKNKKNAQYNMCWTPLSPAKTNNVNKTLDLIPTTGVKDERNIVFMWKS